jgi:hypothetical protein
VAEEYVGKLLAWAHMPTLAEEEALKNCTSGVKENAVKVVFIVALRPVVGRRGNRTKVSPPWSGLPAVSRAWKRRTGL